MSLTLLVPIGDGHVALVDYADRDLVAGLSWRALRGHNGKIYAAAKGGRTTAYMHRLIIGTPKGKETDHINGDGLDNRRVNLRIATSSQNSANMGKPQRPDGSSHTSKFKGVTWHEPRGKWQAKITVGKVCRSLGRYDTEEEAARAYDVAAQLAWPRFARLNFPAVAE